jgi:transposase
LHGELIAASAFVTYQTVRACIATLHAAPPQAPHPPPTLRRVTGSLTRHPSTLSEDERAALKDVLARCPELDAAARHVRGFGDILTRDSARRFPTGSTPSMHCPLPALITFALHLLRDLDAVTVGLTLHWSSRGTEGAVNRIKKIRRQPWGGAGFELLARGLCISDLPRLRHKVACQNRFLP